MNLQEELKVIIEKINKEGIVVIVEGKKDKAALLKMGLKKVKVIKGPLYKFCEDLAEKEVCILTDFDKEGKKLYARIKSLLQANGVKIYDKARIAFMRFMRNKGLVHIEGIKNEIEGGVKELEKF